MLVCENMSLKDLTNDQCVGPLSIKFVIADLHELTITHD